MNTQSHRLKRSSTGTPTLSKAVSLGLLSLCAALPLATSHAQEAAEPASASMQRQHSFDLDAQPLADSLIAFAQQSGLQVSVDPSLVGHLRGNVVRGQMSSEQALSRLLDGSNVGWDYEQQVLTFHALKSSQNAMELGNTVVLAAADQSFMGETVVDRRAIEAFPAANGDITTLLQMHPSVQFSNTQQSSSTPGEIDPADISINGAAFYQNSFMIDGVGINNDLDPGRHEWSTIADARGTPSRSHGIALDADLLEEVRVYDSNVPAEYGGFNGGVINAVTRRPSEDLHGKLSMSMSRSAWANYHINEEDREDFENSTTSQEQPEFDKWTLRGTLEGHVTENFGALFNFSRKHSTIPLNSYSDGFNSTGDKSKKDQTRQIDNFLLKTYWQVNDRLQLDVSLTHAPQESEYFRENSKNSDFVILQGGQQAAIKATWFGDAAKFTHNLAYTNLQSSRDSDSNVSKQWRWSSEKNWGNPLRDTSLSREGSFGDIEQRQKSMTYTFKSDWEPIQALGIEHNFQAGLELAYQQANYKRPESATTAAGLIATAAGSNSCSFASGELDSEYCSIGTNVSGTLTRQYFRNLTHYNAGEISMNEKRYALFLQDRMQWGRLQVRPGVRFDGDDYMEKKTIAPRFSADYDLFGDSSTVLTTGFNRYYGRSMFKYRLADGRESLEYRQSRATASGTTVNEFGAITRGEADSSSFRKIDIPYNDEWMVGIAQRWLNTTFELKYVHRDGRDQVVRTQGVNLGLPPGDGVDESIVYTTYTNAGSSETDAVSLAITPDAELRLFGTRSSMQFAADWTRTRSTNNSNYDVSFSRDELNDELVMYDGKLMRFSQLPAANFNRPWTARITTITHVPQANLTLSNFLRYRAGYEQIVTDGTIEVEGATYDNYSFGEVNAAFTWDLRAKWEIPVIRDQSAFVAVDVKNVLDEVAEIYSSTGYKYEMGRQYWLEVGYQF
ncbi:TonB-dependent receptor [Phytopseudomonas seleniipraecipitans]|uniref:Outer membrane receptor proteins, mostly Fe transport n=1 Tax=Phytopseudomonas seleniipraecipitans TaxID=640205 RepID=A0A1G7LZ57_9GAMM|nr:TonB-dependent receptor [Pseudomonas seleniipraecipitans]SDF54686.1 Outer membrane receptor proteins, mostly Fe transport [Pseudomonas seleniipraecipitans]